MVPRRLDEQFIRDQDNFADSLTPELQQLLLRGARLAEMPRIYREAWLRINTAHAYAPTALELERAARCLERWSQADLVDLAPPNTHRQRFDVIVPDMTTDDGVMRCSLSVAKSGRSAGPTTDGIELAAPPKAVPQDLRAPWNLPVLKITLGALVERLKAEGGPGVQVPPYARGRVVWVSSRSGTRAEVLEALALLWGWELAPARDGYRLRRPALPRPRNPVELHAAMNRVVPPAFFHTLRRCHAGGTDRMSRQMELVVQDADRVAGPDWRCVEEARLSPLAQQRLSNCTALMQLVSGTADTAASRRRHG